MSKLRGIEWAGGLGTFLYVLGLVGFTGLSVFADSPAHFLSLRQRSAQVVARSPELLNTHSLPVEVNREVGVWLSSFHAPFESAAEFWAPFAAEASLRREIYQYLQDQVWVPELTQEEYEKFRAEVERRGGTTQLTGPLPGFWAPRPVVSIGLAKALLGHLPTGLAQNRFDSPNAFGEALAEWKEHPDFPALYLELQDAQAVADKINHELGLRDSRFQVPSDQELELLIRGRDAHGHVTVTDYYFGDFASPGPRLRVPAEFQKMIWCGKGKKLGVRERPGQKGYVNSFGIIHPVGNVALKSADEHCTGLAYNSLSIGDAKSGSSIPCNLNRLSKTAYRLIEKRSALGR